MATLVAHTPTDMSEWDFFDDIESGTVVGSTATAWTVDGATGCTYSFAGHNLVYGAGLVPVGGSITDFSFSDNGTPGFSLHGVLSAAALTHAIESGTPDDLQRRWFSGDDRFIGSSGSDHLLGFKGSDFFRLDKGGSDTAMGGKGDDTFVLRGTFDNTDRIRGDAGTDTLKLNADYVLFCSPGMLSNVEIVELVKGHGYILHFDGQNVGQGGLLVDGSALRGHSLEVYLHDSTRGIAALGGHGADVLAGSLGRDVFDGGGAADVLSGRGGADVLTGGAGLDVFAYADASDSTGIRYDTISDFNPRIDMIGLDHLLLGVNARVKHGDLTQLQFNDSLEQAVDAVALDPFHAMLFAPDSGDFVGQTFLVIDANGMAGYQHGADYVVMLNAFSHAGALGLEDFVLMI